jgi:hypothetical protein
MKARASWESRIKTRAVVGVTHSKDQLYRAEIENMANQVFPRSYGSRQVRTPSDLTGRLQTVLLTIPQSVDGQSIGTQVLQPDVPLDRNLVKALIAHGVGFDPTADTKVKGSGRARGLMQLTDGTRKILQDEKGNC